MILSLHRIHQLSSSLSSSASVLGTGRVLAGGAWILVRGVCGRVIVLPGIPPGGVGELTTPGGGVITGGLVIAGGVEGRGGAVETGGGVGVGGVGVVGGAAIGRFFRFAGS